MDKRKLMALTSVVCILPAVACLIIYGGLPEEIPIQFNLGGPAGSTAPKWFVAFGMPGFLLLFNIFCHWKVNRTAEEFDALLSKELAKPAWIMDGNYRRTFSRRLRYADFCAVLDVDDETCLCNAKERAEKYAGRSRPDMADGCIERVADDFVEWIGQYREKVLPEMLDILKESGVPYRVFSSSAQAEKWFAETCEK